MVNDPITLCEGSGCLTHFHSIEHGVCATCGWTVQTDPDGKAERHAEPTLAALVDRGDFG